MSPKQTLWNRILGRHVSEEHFARRYGSPGSGQRTSTVIITVYKYPGFIRRFCRKIKFDKSDWRMVVFKRYEKSQSKGKFTFGG